MNTATEQQNRISRNQCLTRVIKGLTSPDSMDKVLVEVEKDILALFSAERITLYQYSLEEQALVAEYTARNGESKTSRLKLGMLSIAGFVGMAQKALQITNAYNSEELREISQGLVFDTHLDMQLGVRTKSMMALPIESNGSLLGVLQLRNKQNAPSFTDEDLEVATKIAAFLGKKIGRLVKISSSPFQALVEKNKITASQLNTFLQQSDSLDGTVERIVKHTNVSMEQVGYSLEQYFQVPFMTYQPKKYWRHPLVENFNQNLLKEMEFILLTDENENIIVLIANPKDTKYRRTIQNVIGPKYCKIFIGLESDIKRYIEPPEALKPENVKASIKSSVELTLNDSAYAGLMSQMVEHLDPLKNKKPDKVASRSQGANQLVIDESFDGEVLVVNSFSGTPELEMENKALANNIRMELDPTQGDELEMNASDFLLEEEHTITLDPEPIQKPNINESDDEIMLTVNDSSGAE